MPNTSFILCSTRITVRSADSFHDQVHHAARFFRRHASGGFIEQHKAWPTGKCHRHLEAALLAVRQIGSLSLRYVS